MSEIKMEELNRSLYDLKLKRADKNAQLIEKHKLYGTEHRQLKEHVRRVVDMHAKEKLMIRCKKEQQDPSV